eukprot:5782054-Amphidinium_carterae.1
MHDIRVWAYVDDVTFQAPQHLASVVAELWSQALAAPGMELSTLKAKVWIPSEAEPAEPFLKELLAKQPRVDGMTVCGQPMALHETNQIRDRATPVGSVSFVDAFLDTCLVDEQRRIDALACIPALLNAQQGALHAGFLTIKCSVLHKHTHTFVSHLASTSHQAVGGKGGCYDRPATRMAIPLEDSAKR